MSIKGALSENNIADCRPLQWGSFEYYKFDNELHQILKVRATLGPICPYQAQFTIFGITLLSQSIQNAEPIYPPAEKNKQKNQTEPETVYFNRMRKKSIHFLSHCRRFFFSVCSGEIEYEICVFLHTIFDIWKYVSSWCLACNYAKNIHLNLNGSCIQIV